MLRELNALTEKEEERARGWLKASNGRAFVVVHPFFHEKDMSLGLGISEKKFESLLFPPSGDVKTPVFLFEQYGRMEKTIEKIREMEAGHAEEKRRGIVIVATGFDKPDPFHGSWNGLTDRMKSLGAEKLFICGRLLGYFDRRKENLDYYQNIADRTNDPKADLMLQEISEFYKTDEKVSALEKAHYSGIFNQVAAQAIQRGASKEEMEKRRERYMEKTHFGARFCVGQAYKQFLLSGKFKAVRIMGRYSNDMFWSEGKREK
ncbi:MAG: hypothetical protein NTY90_05805 [Candidatus Micrarchaeota archaeon]|nr:hypothetical protein [Candidatus Micrarchaeota archaeon]